MTACSSCFWPCMAPLCCCGRHLGCNQRSGPHTEPRTMSVCSTYTHIQYIFHLQRPAMTRCLQEGVQTMRHKPAAAMPHRKNEATHSHGTPTTPYTHAIIDAPKHPLASYLSYIVDTSPESVASNNCTIEGGSVARLGKARR